MLLNVEVVCPFCGSVSFVEVNANDFERWQSGELAQKSFPYLTASERETLISGMCEFCQEEFF